MRCTKAIILTAGFGTRRLPITKAIEKCMLPIGNQPLVDYVVEDCIKAGITDIIFVVGDQSSQIRTYYGHNELLERYLQNKGKTQLLQQVTEVATQATFHFVVQDSSMPYGTAVPVALCKEFIKPHEQVVVIGGDDFIYNADGSSEVARLLQSVESAGATAGLLAAHVPKAEVSRYGVIDMDETSEQPVFKRIVEQPKVEEAPSNLINISKYVFDHKLMMAVDDVLQNPPAANGEYQIIEALNLYVQNGSSLVVVPAKGEYLDGGTVEGWLNANQRVSEGASHAQK